MRRRQYRTLRVTFLLFIFVSPPLPPEMNGTRTTRSAVERCRAGGQTTRVGGNNNDPQQYPSILVPVVEHDLQQFDIQLVPAVGLPCVYGNSVSGTRVRPLGADRLEHYKLDELI